MLIREFLEKRYSAREYEQKQLSESTIKTIVDYAREIEASIKSVKVKFIFLKDGTVIFEKLNGYAGYAGVMIKSPHYIGILTEDENYRTQIAASYAMQSLIKKLFEMGLGTCWIDFSKAGERLQDELAGSELKNINYAVSVGYPKKESRFKFVYVPSTSYSSVSNNPYRQISESKSDKSGERLPIDQFVFKDEFGTHVSLDELEQRGLADVFSLVRNAPSARNLQPWRFILQNERIVMAVKNPSSKESMTDAGIMMYLFEGMAHDSGIRGEWSLLPFEEFEYQNDKYAYVGEFRV